MIDDENYPSDRRYTAQHQWARREEDGRWRIGITRFSHQFLDAVIALELPEAGERVDEGELYGYIQSLVGPMRELYAPAAGQVVEVNEELLEDPEVLFVDDDPYGDGWLIRLAPDDPGAYEHLLSAAAYRERAGVPAG